MRFIEWRTIDKTKKKMAGLVSGNLQVSAYGEVQLAQVEVWYYGFDTETEEIYYWYPADDVIVTETWIEYTPDLIKFDFGDPRPLSRGGFLCAELERQLGVEVLYPA